MHRVRPALWIRDFAFDSRLIFIWWRGATLGTLFTTWFSGQAVGTDTFGNRYYQSKRGRRWVIYNGTVEASRVPPDWHGWLHHTFKEPPTQAPQPTRPWERAHRVNMSGTDGAYRPQGSLAETGVRPPATGDYQAWKPD
jgi:NADH:ubiquinone oxidoreductase subunit